MKGGRTVGEFFAEFTSEKDKARASQGLSNALRANYVKVLP
jgi:hypothetical protein